jgi:hypothetical protein
MPDVVSQPGPQPLKTDRSAGLAVRVTTVLLSNAAEQVPPQSIPAGLDVTVPPKRMPVLLTVKVYFTTNALLLVAVPPGAVTVSGPVVAAAGTVV